MTECEPGKAARQALQFIQPFTAFKLDSQLNANLELVCQQPEQVNNVRTQALNYWEKQAQDLLLQSLMELNQFQEAPVRHLLRIFPDNVIPELGQCFHVALWRAMAAAGSCRDQHLVNEMLQGLNIVVEISRPFGWPVLHKKDDALPVALLLDRAWEIRAKIMKNAQGVPITDHSKEFWDSTFEDRDEVLV